MDTYYVPFTKEMAKDYTILIPTMLPMHFQMIACICGPTATRSSCWTPPAPKLPRPA